MYRQLSKVYGLRFVITVTGEAGRFSVLPLLVRLGSGLGLLSLATIITDLFLLNLTGKKKLLYRRLKELNHNNEVIIRLHFDSTLLLSSLHASLASQTADVPLHRAKVQSMKRAMSMSLTVDSWLS